MTPALARIKRAVRDVIGLCGGVDGASATASRKRSVAGDWNNRNTDAFPPMDCAFAMDEAALMAEGRAPILERYAAELGHVAIRLPDAMFGEDALTGALIEVSAEFGDLAHAVRDATRDGVVSSAERDRILMEIDHGQASLARMRSLLVHADMAATPIRGAREAAQS